MNTNKKIDAIFFAIILSAALTGSIICSIAYSASDSVITPINKDTLTFMAYNIHFGFGMDDLLDMERIAQNIEDSGVNPDILGLEEAELGRITSGGVDMAFWLAQRLNMPYFFYEPAVNGEAFGVAILSKYSWNSVKGEILPSISLERPLIHAEFTLNSGNPLHVFVTHIGFGDENVTAQINSVMARISDIGADETVLMGDFNFNSSTSYYQTVTDTFRDTCGELGNIGGTFPSYPEPNVDERIDYIFLKSSTATVSKADRIVDFDVSGNFPVEFGSDHLPIYATISFV
ncbi:MAG: endonuclease/exonuclease/phosphatase family protein [Promethearchaeota archaeon]